MKILIATGIYPPDIGGPATYAKLMTEKLPSLGIEVEVVSFGLVRKYPKVIRHVLYFFKIFKKAFWVDAIFTQDTISTGLPALLVSKLLMKPLVLRVPGDYVWEQSAQRYGVKDSIDDFQNKKYGFKVESLRILQKMTVRYANVVLAPSEYFRELVNKWTKRKSPVKRLYNGVDLSVSFDKKEKFDKPTLITAGRLVPWKGIDVLIETMTNLPEWQLIIAGDGPERENLEALTDKLNLSSRIVFLGNVARSELFTQIYRSQIFVLNTSFESFSFQIVESMFLGTPVIATKVGNLSEIIENGKEGILVEPNDKSAIIEYVKKISKDQDFREIIIRNAKEKSQKFSIDNTMQGLASIFKELVGK